MRLYRRRTHVGHSPAGWDLTVWDRYIPALLSLPLTAEQAAAIEPEWVASYLATAEDA